MKICDGMYFILGQQLCQYVGFECPYQGKQAQLSLKSDLGIVTYCTLNNIERLLEETDD